MSSAFGVDCKNSAYLATGGIPFLLQDVKAREWILNSTIFVKSRPTEPLQTSVALLPEEDCPHIVI